MANYLPLGSFLLVLNLSFLQLVDAAPQTTTAKRESLLTVRETFYSYQVNPSSILWSPACASADPNSCLGANAIKTCTIKYCSKKVALTCWHHAYKIDLHCLCESMNDTTCTSCSSGINNELYLAWLAATCSKSPDWHGLSPDWNQSLPEWDIIQIGSSSSSNSGHTYEDKNPFTSQWVKDNHNYPLTLYPPDCSANCTWLNSRWNASIIDGNVADALTRANLLPMNYASGGSPQNKTFYLDRTLFCTGWQWDDFQSNCTGICGTSLDNTGLLAWLNSTCGNITEFKGLPNGWSNSLVVLNSTYPTQHNFTWPSCLKGNNSDCQLNVTESQCTSLRCELDKYGVCTPTLAVSLECFCSTIQYGTNCTRNCGLSWERKEYLGWINNTCFPIGPGTGLPSNWSSLLPVQRSEMLPWNWQLSSEVASSPNATSHPHCPSASSKLWAFAAVNLCLALLIPIIGRRTVVKKITYGYFGRQESQKWWLTGPAAVALHLASNVVNAVIIKNTVGFENINIKDLTFLWCTRPRIAWLIVALIPWQAEKAMYFSSAASTLFSEVVLQLFGSYYMGVGANYARRQKFFIKDHLAGTWYGKQAMIMYAGSILWLTVVAFAIAACMSTIFGVSGRIAILGQYWTQTRRVVKLNYTLVSREIGALLSAKSKLKPLKDVPWRHTGERLHRNIFVSIDTLVEEWNELATTWKLMPDELRKETNIRKAIKSRERKATALLENTRESSKNWQKRFKQSNDALQAVADFNITWFATPDTKQSEARAQQTRIRDQIYAYTLEKATVSELVSQCEARIYPLMKAIKATQALIDDDSSELDRLTVSQQKQLGVYEHEYLKSRRETLVIQRLAHQEELKAAENNPRLIQEQAQKQDFQAVVDLWTEAIKSRTNLGKNWKENEKMWRKVADERKKHWEGKPQVGHFPPLVVAGMLLCWIAQWLWWAGYIGVAGDGYCPPKLPLMASIWTLFSSVGMVFGTSF